jgi:hypothetical protein
MYYNSILFVVNQSCTYVDTRMTRVKMKWKILCTHPHVEIHISIIIHQNPPRLMLITVVSLIVYAQTVICCQWWWCSAEVNQMVGNLRNMAVDMGTEIEAQNRLLDSVNQKAESNTVRVNKANQRANKLLQ